MVDALFGEKFSKCKERKHLVSFYIFMSNAVFSLILRMGKSSRISLHAQYDAVSVSRTLTAEFCKKVVDVFVFRAEEHVEI